MTIETIPSCMCKEKWHEIEGANILPNCMYLLVLYLWANSSALGMRIIVSACHYMTTTTIKTNLIIVGIFHKHFLCIRVVTTII